MADPTCTLCDLPVPEPPVTDPDVPGTFCCQGCLEVHRRVGEAENPDGAAAVLGADGNDTAGADGETAFLTIEGMHCATCEAFIETEALDTDGVRAAEASYATGLARVTYDPEITAPSEVAGAVSGLGYDAAPADAAPRGTDEREASTGRLLVGGFFGMMTMLWYALFLYPAYLGVPPGRLPLDVTGPAGRYLLANLWVFATVVLGYTGFPILRGAYVSLRSGFPDMDLLVSLAAGTAYVYSTIALALGRTEVYFDITVVVVLAVTLGGHYEGRIRRRAVGRLADLAGEGVDRATRRTSDGTETVPTDALTPGDELVVGAGERIPVDGTVREGTAAVDEALVTGESVPVRKTAGDAVLGGAVVADGGVVIEVGPDATSTVDRLVSLLWEIQSARPGAQRLADRLAAVFVPGVIAAATLVGAHRFLTGGNPTAALLTALTVLVVSCPCALGLATPLAVAAGLRDALTRGIAITGQAVFERDHDIDVVAFDKTGTLTTGRMRLIEDRTDTHVLELAAAVERFASHPIAGAITDAVEPPERPVEAVEHHPGRGIEATVDDERVLVGDRDLFGAEGWSIPPSLAERAAAAREEGYLPALVGRDGRAEGLVVAGDTPRAEWGEVVAEIASDREVVVLTGDEGPAADRFRTHPDVSEVYAGVPPEGKAAVIERLREEGRVAMVGDGANDAPSLAAADLGIALRSGTALAADAADAVITTDRLDAVPAVFDLMGATQRRIRQNLGWAFLYNAIAIPIAAVGALNPLFAAVAMASSSLLVVANSGRSLLPGR